MTRRHFSFPCEGSHLAATCDGEDADIGLLIVSGGNETRAGVFNGQAALAQKIAANGFPVMRFDRRGVGDAEGHNGGFRSAQPDISAAAEQLRCAFPSLKRLVAFGNCDAATALILREGSGFDAMVLANPWALDNERGGAPLPPPAAIRGRYIEKLRNPREWLRLVRGEIRVGNVMKGLRAAAKRKAPASALARELQEKLARYHGNLRILLAGRDRTAQIFAASLPRDDARVAILPDADHAFSGPDAQQWLSDAILAVLHEQARQLDMR